MSLNPYEAPVADAEIVSQPSQDLKRVSSGRNLISLPFFLVALGLAVFFLLSLADVPKFIDSSALFLGLFCCCVGSIALCSFGFFSLGLGLRVNKLKFRIRGYLFAGGGFAAFCVCGYFLSQQAC